MTTVHIHGVSRALRGVMTPPPDKSISHRALLLAAMAEGTSTLTSVLDSEDVRSTLGAVRALGAAVEIAREGEGSFDCVVHGWGARGPVTPDAPVCCGNSGTTARLLSGVVAGWPVTVTLTGDESLSARPMGRVIEPLTRMGARFDATDGAFLPMTVFGGQLSGIEYAVPVASAQVKSAILLAGVRANGTTVVREPAPSRDHTERLLPAFGVPVMTEPCRAEVTGPAAPAAFDVEVPGDPSSAAFLIAAAVLIEGSDIELPRVCLNPTRTGFLRVLTRMGADVQVRDVTEMGAEPVGTVRARYTPGLVATHIPEDEVPSLVDEVPVLAVVASRARGTTVFHGVGELRVKETDRLSATADGVLAFGGRAVVDNDRLMVAGPARPEPAHVDSLLDHRLAMSWAVAGLATAGETVIDRFEAVDVSYPGFMSDLAAAAAGEGVE